MQELFVALVESRRWPIQNVARFVLRTQDSEFGLNDPKSQGSTHSPLLVPVTSGTARYDNPSSTIVYIGHYGALVNELPATVAPPQNCDFILSTDNESHFLLNELKECQSKKPKYPVAQLRQTLNDLWNVPSIQSQLMRYTHRKCCLFRQFSQSVPVVKASKSFNRINSLHQSGYKRDDPVINRFGFEFWVYSGDQHCQLV